jgi:hypothetical protein
VYLIQMELTVIGLRVFNLALQKTSTICRIGEDTNQQVICADTEVIPEDDCHEALKKFMK